MKMQMNGDFFLFFYFFFNLYFLIDLLLKCHCSSIFCPLCFADVGSVEGLAYHRGWDTLYWTSYTTSTITRHTVDQSRFVAYNRNTVITMSGEDHPRAFVLDECQE